jgi:hypothetical protein
LEIKREIKSPSKLSTSDQQRRYSSSTNTSNTIINEKNIQSKIEDTKNKTILRHSSERYERSDRSMLFKYFSSFNSIFLYFKKAAPQLTPPIVQLSPTPELSSEKGSITHSNELEKITSIQPPSPICVILDDDSSPSPSIEKKIIRQISEKKFNENEKNNSKQTKRSRDSDKNSNKDKISEHIETKRKRLNDGSRKIISSSKNENDNRSTSNRLENKKQN